MIKPIKQQVLLRPVPPPKETGGGILLPDYVDAYRNRFSVVAAADDCYDVRDGDTVLLPDSGGIQVQVGDEQLVSIHESKVLAIL